MSRVANTESASSRIRVHRLDSVSHEHEHAQVVVTPRIFVPQTMCQGTQSCTRIPNTRMRGLLLSTDILAGPVCCGQTHQALGPWTGITQRTDSSCRCTHTARRCGRGGILFQRPNSETALPSLARCMFDYLLDQHSAQLHHLAIGQSCSATTSRSTFGVGIAHVARTPRGLASHGGLRPSD
jgi:hypothetical protein